MAWSPYKKPARQEKSNNSAIILLIVFVLLFIFSFSLVRKSRVLPDGNDVVVIDEDEQQVDLKDSYIVRLYETEADKQPVWLVQLLDNDSFWIDWISSQEMRYFTLDPGSQVDQSQSFMEVAKKRNLKLPLWMHVAKGGKVISAKAFEESTTVEEIKKIVQRKGK